MIVDLFAQLGQHYDRDCDVTKEHRGDYDDGLVLEKGTCQVDLTVDARFQRLVNLAHDVDRREEPEVDVDASLPPTRVPPHHQDVDTQQEPVEHHVADVHHQYRQILNDLEPAHEEFRVTCLDEAHGEVDATGYEPEEDTDNDCCLALSNRGLTVLAAPALRNFAVIVSIADQSTDHGEQDCIVDEKESLARRLSCFLAAVAQQADIFIGLRGVRVLIERLWAVRLPLDIQSNCHLLKLLSINYQSILFYLAAPTN